MVLTAIVWSNFYQLTRRPSYQRDPDVAGRGFRPGDLRVVAGVLHGVAPVWGEDADCSFAQDISCGRGRGARKRWQERGEELERKGGELHL